MHREQQGRCQAHPRPSAPPGNPANTTLEGTLQKESLSSLQSISVQCLRNCGKRKEWAAGRAQPPCIPGWAGHTSIQRPLYMPE